MKDRRVVIIDYTNWRGERRERLVEPIMIAFTHTEHHPTPGWLMLCRDIEKGEKRWFAMCDVHAMRPAS